jgi:hypothetical protein
VFSHCGTGSSPNNGSPSFGAGHNWKPNQRYQSERSAHPERILVLPQFPPPFLKFKLYFRQITKYYAEKRQLSRKRFPFSYLYAFKGENPFLSGKIFYKFFRVEKRK